MKWLVALVCMLAALACGYGLLASFEPGTPVLWKIGYGLGALVFLAAALRQAKRG